MPDRVARDLVVHGRVQGVFFRAFVQRAGSRSKVAGRAKNREDGTVAIHLEGDRAAVDSVERSCGEGPEGARVERIDAVDAEVEGLDGFDVS